MIKNTLDIINRARELADLQNSDFIGWKENNNLLNEAFIKLYTELINHKDRYYINTISVKDLELYKSSENENYYKLPDNFYMLNSVYRGESGNIVLRKAPTETKNNARYDIINNCIVLYGGLEKDTITIEYWPIPQTLYLKAPTRKIELPEGYKWIDCNDNKYLGYKKINNTTEFICYNLRTNTSKRIVINTGYTDCEGAYSDIFTFVKCDNTYYILDFYNKTYTPAAEEYGAHDYYYIGKGNNNVYALAHNNGDNFTLLYAKDYRNFTINRLYNYTVKNKFAIDNEGVLYFVADNSIYAYEEDELEVLYDDAIGYINCFDNSVYYETMEGIFENDKKILSKFKEYEHIIGVNKLDTDTGYGISAIDEDNSYYVFSVFENSKIEFPNNFYYQYLSYMLAIAYKAKQNADSTALQDLANRESTQFYNAINQDVNQDLRIKNIYSAGGWL